MGDRDPGRGYVPPADASDGSAAEDVEGAVGSTGVTMVENLPSAEELERQTANLKARLEAAKQEQEAAREREVESGVSEYEKLSALLPEIDKGIVAARDAVAAYAGISEELRTNTDRDNQAQLVEILAAYENNREVLLVKQAALLAVPEVVIRIDDKATREDLLREGEVMVKERVASLRGPLAETAVRVEETVDLERRDMNSESSAHSKVHQIYHTQKDAISRINAPFADQLKRIYISSNTPDELVAGLIDARKLFGAFRGRKERAAIDSILNSSAELNAWGEALRLKAEKTQDKVTARSQFDAVVAEAEVTGKLLKSIDERTQVKQPAGQIDYSTYREPFCGSFRYELRKEALGIVSALCGQKELGGRFTSDVSNEIENALYRVIPA